jgi:hypothetical protein
MHESALVGEHDGLGPVAQAGLGEDARYVRLDGGQAQEEVGRDLRVRVAACEAAHHVELAIAARRQRLTH